MDPFSFRPFQDPHPRPTPELPHHHASDTLTLALKTLRAFRPSKDPHPGPTPEPTTMLEQYEIEIVFFICIFQELICSLDFHMHGPISFLP